MYSYCYFFNQVHPKRYLWQLKIVTFCQEHPKSGWLIIPLSKMTHIPNLFIRNLPIVYTPHVASDFFRSHGVTAEYPATPWPLHLNVSDECALKNEVHDNISCSYSMMHIPNLFILESPHSTCTACYQWFFFSESILHCPLRFGFRCVVLNLRLHSVLLSRCVHQKIVRMTLLHQSDLCVQMRLKNY